MRGSETLSTKWLVQMSAQTKRIGVMMATRIPAKILRIKACSLTRIRKVDLESVNKE
jgi:hypothetical protein